jgi:hypothetical protein
VDLDTDLLGRIIRSFEWAWFRYCDAGKSAGAVKRFSDSFGFAHGALAGCRCNGLLGCESRGSIVTQERDKMRIIFSTILAGVMAGILSPVSAQTRTPHTQPAKDWEACVVSAAQRWSRNNERADVIAEGALGKCLPQEPADVTDAQRMAVKQQAIAAVLDKSIP